MGGKGGVAQAPDYTPVAQANEAAARIAAEVSREQLAWAKEVYERDSQTTARVVDQFLRTMTAESDAAAGDRERYQRIFQPLEDRLISDAVKDREFYDANVRPIEELFLKDALTDRERYRTQVVPLEDALFRDAATYDSPERREAEAGRAMADVAGQFAAQREGAIAQLASFGVDPSMARAGALDTGMRVAQAAAGAGAANDARLRVEATGMALRESAIGIGRFGADALARGASLGPQYTGGIANAVNVGRGYPGQVGSAYQTAQQSGTGAVGANATTTASGQAGMGTGVQWAGIQQGALGNWGRDITSQINSANAANAQAAAARSAGMGAIAGGVLGFAGRFLPG